MTFDREPDLDNANVGMPNAKNWEQRSTLEVTESVTSFFVILGVKRLYPKRSDG